MPRLDLKTANLVAVARAMAYDDPEKCAKEWRNNLHTEGELLELNKRVEGTFAFKHSALFEITKLAVMIGLAVALVQGEMLVHQLIQTNYVSAWGQEAVCWVVLLTVLLWVCQDVLTDEFGWNSGTARYILRNLEPLAATPSKCSEALALCKTSASAEAYQQTVLALGRDFRVFDLNAIKALATYDEGVARHKIDTENCKTLHGVN